MVKFNYDLIKAAILPIAIVVYSSVMIYLLVINNNDLTGLKFIGYINIKISIACGVIALLNMRIISFYFMKTTGFRYGDTTNNKYINFIEYIGIILISFSTAAVFWILVFLGLFLK